MPKTKLERVLDALKDARTFFKSRNLADRLRVKRGTVSWVLSHLADLGYIRLRTFASGKTLWIPTLKFRKAPKEEVKRDLFNYGLEIRKQKRRTQSPRPKESKLAREIKEMLRHGIRKEIEKYFSMQ